MDIFVSLAKKIIEEQETIIGPVAFEQAQKVMGINVNFKTHEVSLVGDKKNILGNLVKQYEGLFGQASVEVCREAASKFASKIPSDQLPTVLQ